MAFVVLDLPAPGVARLTIDRADKRNALSIAVRDEMSDHLDALAADEDVRAVVITGTGPVFCAGFDLREFETAAGNDAFAARLWASSDRYHRAVLHFPLVTIAAVNGPALAGGFDLAVCCDLRVASTTARFAHPERTFAEVVYGPLHDLVGGAVARELTMAGRELDADEALARRVVSAVVEPEDLAAASVDLATRVAEAPRASLAHTKAKALRRAGFDPGSPTLDL
jgi:enoyl-CoA hydratase/carnithine racemase